MDFEAHGTAFYMLVLDPPQWRWRLNYSNLMKPKSLDNSMIHTKTSLVDLAISGKKGFM